MFHWKFWNGMLYIFWKVWPRAIHLTKIYPPAYNTHIPAYLPIHLFWLLSFDLWEKKVRAKVCLLIICLRVLRPLFCNNCHMLVVADYSSPVQKHVINIHHWVFCKNIFVTASYVLTCPNAVDPPPMLEEHVPKSLQTMDSSLGPPKPGQVCY